MRLRELLISVAAILSLTAAPVLAGPKGAPPKSAGPKATQTHGSPKTTASSPKTTTSHGNPKTTTTGATSHGSPKKTGTTTTTATTPTSTSTSTTSGTAATTTTTTTTQLNPIAQKISSNKGLSSKMDSLLPKNMTLNEASLGFKNQGQFIAALHVSQNLGIPFADLKTAMTGIKPITTTTTGGTTVAGSATTGGTTVGVTASSGTTTTSSTSSTPLLSLGQAIHKLRPSADSTTAETTATRQATADLGGK